MPTLKEINLAVKTFVTHGTAKTAYCYHRFMISVDLCVHISNVPFTKDYWIKITGERYHLANATTFSLAQSDHISRFLLYVLRILRMKIYLNMISTYSGMANTWLNWILGYTEYLVILNTWLYWILAYT